MDRLRELALGRITCDFDGSVQSTGRRAEGTAVGFNKKKKVARSYYPLFCTIAQTLQILDFLPRSGNVHDSRGARAFIDECIGLIRQALPHAVIEVRADNRAALWVFGRVDTVRKTLLQRAGRLTRPGGRLTLTISVGGTVKENCSACSTAYAPRRDANR